MIIFSHYQPRCICNIFARSHSSIPNWLRAVTGLNASKVRQVGDPVLRQKAVQVQPEYMFSPELNRLIETMIKTMREMKGVGIAAPQIGANLRVIAVEFTGKHLKENLKKFGVKGVQKMQMQLYPLQVVINPEMRITDPTTVAFKEGCLSIQGFSAVVPRVQEVEISGLNQKGEKLKFFVGGWIARIFQHEIEHLDGHLYIDSMQYKTFINESWKNNVS